MNKKRFWLESAKGTKHSKWRKKIRQESAMAWQLSIVETEHGQCHHHHGLLLLGGVCLNKAKVHKQQNQKKKESIPTRKKQLLLLRVDEELLLHPALLPRPRLGTKLAPGTQIVLA
jgi:hypothetical protein